MVLRLFSMLGGAFCGFCKPKHQLVFLSLRDYEVELPAGFDKHCYDKTG
jgi:hypothetical protein